MPSIKDVAQRAGVSYTTVSHVINQTRPVRRETAEKVRKAIDEIGYVPCQMARCLKTGKTKTIGVINANTFDIFFNDVILSTQNKLEKKGYSLYFAYSYIEENSCDSDCFDFFAEKEIEYIDKLIARDVDAIIINPINRDEILSTYFAKTKIPMILFQREISAPTTYPILSDDFDGGYQAIRHLIDLGHRTIAIVYGFSYPTHSTAQRRVGAEKAFQNFGSNLPELSWHYCNYSADNAYELSLKILKKKDRPTAIFYYSDTMAMAGLRAAADLKISIPSELSILGYDDSHITRFTVPRLSTIRQDSCLMGEHIAEKTIEFLENPEGDPPRPEKKLPVTLIIRESTGPMENQETRSPEEAVRSGR